MARLCLRLENEDGTFKEYRKEKVKAYWVKEALKHNKEIAALEKKNDAVGILDARLKFTCDFFGDKELTPDAILEGLEADKLFPALDLIFSTLMGTNEENNEQGK